MKELITSNYQIELRHYVYFLAVAQELHFRKAAEKLFISQPGLSTQIRQMEALLGVQLFTRDKKKVALTSEGEYLKKEVVFLLSHIRQTKKQLHLMKKGQLGEIRIGFLGSAMQNVVPNLILKLQEQYPKINTSLDELSNTAQLDALYKDQLDLGFVRLGTVPKSLEMKPVFTDTFSLVVPENFYLNDTNFKGMHQVAEEPFIFFAKDYSPYYYDMVVSICNDAGFQPKVTHKSVHGQTVYRLIENGLGLAIVPTSLKYGFAMKVRFIELTTIKQRAVLSVVWKKDNRNPVLKQCLNLLLANKA